MEQKIIAEAELVEISAIKEDPNNARLHNARNMGQIKASLKRYGQLKPIVVSALTKTILAGNGTYRAASELGWDKIWVSWVWLDANEAKAYALADNASGDSSEFHEEILAQTLKDLEMQNPYQDWESVGFDEEQVRELIDSLDADLDEEQTVEEDSASGEEDAPEMGLPIRLTAEQREIIDLVIEMVRESCDDLEMSEGRCLELVCGDYLSANRPHKSGHPESFDENLENF